MDKVQKIREGVVGLLSNHDSALDYEAAIEDVLSIIDSMREQPISNDLEEVVKKLWNEINSGHEYSVIESYNVFYGLCLDIANWKKEQIMSKAIDAKVLENFDGKDIEYDETILDEKLSNCNVFDKVKVIVIKEG